MPVFSETVETGSQWTCSLIVLPLCLLHSYSVLSCGLNVNAQQKKNQTISLSSVSVRFELCYYQSAVFVINYRFQVYVVPVTLHIVFQ